MLSIESQKDLVFSGERFKVDYLITGEEASAFRKAEDICVEETVEFPYELLPEGAIRKNILGKIESFQQVEDCKYQTTISYAVEITSFELTQFLTVVYGNISHIKGIRVLRFDLSPALMDVFPGPRFGQDGWRKILNVYGRPILCAAIKPMGCSTRELAEMAYQFAKGGIDILKDDHGFSNQHFSPFKERVLRCIEAIHKANHETQGKSIFVPNITAPMDQLYARAQFAAENGAGGLMMCPGIVGFDTMRMISNDNKINLPIISHPTFAGTQVAYQDVGFSNYAFFGQLQRISGADASIHPNFQTRFPISREDVCSIISGCTDPMGPIKAIFPTPGGGINLDNIAELRNFYGEDVIFLVGGGLHKSGNNLVENARYFLESVA